MNEFLQQFVLESRELADAGSHGLLKLEQSPRDSEQLDAVFRAFHTLKGGAGIVEFPAMERLMHAAEDILSKARGGQQPLTTAGVGQCLACLDQVLQWLDSIEGTGELPSDAGADVDRLTRASPQDQTPPERDWFEQLLEASPAALRARAASAVRFVPGAESFYKGEDPLERMASLPGLLRLDCVPVSAWEPLDTLDPFVCNLTITALSSAQSDEIQAHMRGCIGECNIAPVGLAPAAAAVTGSGELPLPSRVADLLRSQQILLNENPVADEALAGLVGSAGRVANNALRFCSRHDEARRVAAATELALHQKSAAPLKEALARLLTPLRQIEAPQVPDTPDAPSGVISDGAV